MRIEEEEITTTRTKYIADDGEIFYNNHDCLYHEWKLSATVVFAVSARGRMSRNDNLELYSTKKLAEKAVDGADGYIITEVYLNQRQWKEL